MMLADEVPLSANIIVLNFANTLSAAQGSCDELVRSLIQSRGVEVTALFPTEKISSFLQTAANLRQVSPLLTVINPELTTI
jgi:predicted outer membrane protein